VKLNYVLFVGCNAAAVGTEQVLALVLEHYFGSDFDQSFPWLSFI
jgi:hypothetical protein